MVKKKKKKRFFALLGSKWNNSANASSFYLNLNNTASNRNRNISSRLEHAIKNFDLNYCTVPHGER